MAFKNRLNFADKRLAIGGADLTIDDRYPLTAPVGRFPNGASVYDLLDMAGNVWEWTADWYDPGYYLVSPYANPLGPASGDRRVTRGGSWYDSANLAMVTVRLPARPQDAHAYLGFRCAR
jgi:formylglycine-generating enzyme required for sulfatase activity